MFWYCTTPELAGATAAMLSAGLATAVAGTGATAGDGTDTAPVGTPLAGATPGAEVLAVPGAGADALPVGPEPGAVALAPPTAPSELAGAGAGTLEFGDDAAESGAGAGAVLGLAAGPGIGALTAGAGAGTPAASQNKLMGWTYATEW